MRYGRRHENTIVVQNNAGGNIAASITLQLDVKQRVLSEYI